VVFGQAGLVNFDVDALVIAIVRAIVARHTNAIVNLAFAQVGLDIDRLKPAGILDSRANAGGHCCSKKEVCESCVGTKI